MEMHNPAHPGEVLDEHYLKPLKLSIAEVARALRVSRYKIASLVKCKGKINADMALRLSHAFNTSPQVWLGMQQQYDLWHAKQKFNPKGVKVLHGKKSKKAA